MAKCKFIGLEEYEKQLLNLQNVTRECIGRAIYEGAAVVADAVKQSIESIPIDDRKYKSKSMLYGISEAQKQGLRDGFGIAKIQDDGGFRHVKLGFAGYNSVITKSYPNGQPNSMIARSVNSGSSFRQRIPFVDNAVNASKGAAENKMKQTFDEVLSKAL